jgi:hypothetical protein
MVGYGPREGLRRFIERSHQQQQDAVIIPAKPDSVPPQVPKDRNLEETINTLHMPIADVAPLEPQS